MQLDWQDILVILTPLVAIIVYFQRETRAKFEQIDKKFEQRFDNVEQKLDDVQRRVIRLEGRFEERGYWESREHRRNGTTDKED